MRAFLAAEIDEELKDKIAEVQKQLKEADAPVKFVEPHNLHFTFKFFGEIDDEKSEEIVSAVEAKVQSYSPFEISINGVGLFPNPRYIRVVWLGVEDAGPFSRLQMAMDEDFQKMGFKKERSYVPHLTMGRVRGAKNKDALLSKIDELKDIEIGKMKIEKLLLKESVLKRDGPVYTTVNEFVL
ncbi:MULTISPECIES: RNA 2',3'-cyclic phosphodiesterase [Methanobacterium]|uniref:RNA 2',3'-cyclic phosphodiesterase n=1 Tax=Methanobacterium bryantii TaxID=2161 RepID=A0A2A2H3X0_METBR|nr:MULTISPECIES: RNA 2',3'-cyclic phosphodiesterase [Methanobacterium]OEC86736.1 2'-5' RNA ligase [Methanobacterium sp. A39]PAV04014.1 2'-5' RNA ligase [Methanobacterium bryantii]